MSFPRRASLALLGLATLALASGCVSTSTRGGYGRSPYGYGGGAGTYHDPYYRGSDPRYRYPSTCRNCGHHRDRYDHERGKKDRPHPLGRAQKEEWRDMRGEQKDEWRDLERQQREERRRLNQAGEWDREDKIRQRQQRQSVSQEHREERRDLRREQRDERQDYPRRRRD